MHLMNRKYSWKRIVAALAAMMMFLQSPLGYMPAMAQTPATVSENNMVSDNSTGSVTEQLLEFEEFVAEEAGDLPLNYVYIENAQLDVLQKQNILISLGDGRYEWKGAMLTLENTADGSGQKVAVSEGKENLLRFSFDTKSFSEGVYRVTELSYSYVEDGVQKKGEISFADVEGMEQTCFGLGTENPMLEAQFTEYTADGQAVSEQMSDELSLDEEQLDVNVVSLQGVEENTNAADKIAQAVQQAEAQMTSMEISAEKKGEKQLSDEDVSADKKVAGSLVVMLDPGHDDTHAGARANGLEEEDLTLKVAEYCKEYLEDNYSDVVVYMSRPGEACPHPGTTSGDCNAYRVVDAFEKQADVYVSLHFNSTVGTTTATGAIVFYPNGNYDGDVGAEGATLASKIIEELEKIGLKNNGIRIQNSGDGTTYPDGSLADYYGVIRRSKEYGIPAVIVEHAFINNPSDAAFLSQEKNIKNLGIADAIGIAKAYKLSTEEVEYDAEDLKVSEIDGGNGTFKITLSGASPVSRIANIKFNVYPTADKTKSYLYTAELVNKKKGIYEVTANVANHGKLTGKYKVIAYAYNAAGKKTQLRSTTAVIEQEKVATSNMKLTYKIAADEKKVTVALRGNENAANVFFKVYSKDGGTDDIKKYQATKKSDGSWKATVKISSHKSMGEYVVAAYSTSYFGESTKVKTGGFKIAGPTVGQVKMTRLDLVKGTFRIVAKNVDSASKVKTVKFVVKTTGGSKINKIYTAKKHKSGYYYADINMKSFKYEYGKYSISVKVKDGNGINEVVKTYKKTIKKPEPVITAKLKSKQTKITITASDLGIAATVKGVKFKVYHTSNSAKKKTYTAKKQKDGSYAVIMKVSDFKKSGTYKILTYVKGMNGKYQKVGSSQKVTVADIKGGKVKTKTKSKTETYFYVSDISYKGDISKVQVKVWPKSKTSAKKTYTATPLKSGYYRVTIDTTNHKKKYGDYGYQVIVTAKNGIKKVLLKGMVKIEKGKDTESEEEPGLYKITGTSAVTVSQMVAYYKKNATYPAYYAASDAPTLKKFCQIYYDECEAEGIKAEVAFAQAMHETNFLRYTGDVDISQYNFAGLGATGNGVKGNSFATVRQGIRAQIQHLKAYANEEPLNKACVDPRFQYVSPRGTAPYVEWLSIPNNPYGKGWAADANYGNALRKHITALRSC